MDRKHILPAAALLLMLIPPLYSDISPGQNPHIKQVRVIAERASIYIEPSRGGNRIDIVGKGALLNLLQTKKVKDIWYHVSFSSSRYGTRISGFVLDSAVELVDETIPPVPEQKKAPEKAESRPPAPPPAAPTPPKAEEKEETKPEPQPPPKVEAKLEPPERPEASEVLVFTQLLRSRSYSFPLKAAPPEELPWRIEAVTPVEEEKRAVEVEELTLLTAPPKPRKIILPKKERSLQDAVWQILPPAVAEIPKEPEKTEAAPQPEKKKEAEIHEVPPPTPTPKKKEAERAKPEVEPVKPQTIKPARIPAPRKGLGRLTFGLGYGSSFGGAGACLQLNIGKGIAVHAGTGIFPTTLVYSDTDWVKNKPLWSVGIKYYLSIKSPLFYPYVDIQYGGLRVEAAQLVIGIWDYDYVYSREQKSLWGPSFLTGVEIRKGRFGICGALGISYVTTSWDFLQDRVSLSFDTSLVIHF
ncbi:MAG: hypothetical protein WAU81_08795 [Candidatus Aminicenantales bacterium]